MTTSDFCSEHQTVGADLDHNCCERKHQNEQTDYGETATAAAAAGNSASERQQRQRQR
eukprot:CAMPEP_0201150270 /NCGR_PEP_ID=MMETSP0851-20130426/11459_1 /ASSEMBLY_ACC=CAM_ASM_000631 /TAXON_ID=183588 /ORGANISM="Pseudo-nitzschia fraudulenta, Strain WWA7" /LENGTH=57 /DNA_ID=CAMNT_0047426909 /DNA_START=10 /DNA_END=179 /DNA_ORIENTATION=+